MEYRKEIDGLRAVAVVPVMLFHAGFDSFNGGYVGVDVFFVVSGYLITSLILEEIRIDSFRIGSFYERRARRILPALFLVVAACVPLAWMWMTPGQLVEFSRSVSAVSVFSSNILFWLETDYFSPSAELSPLLHTWSLAVEEQYYIVFPMLVAVLWRLDSRLLAPVLGLLLLGSLGFSHWWAGHDPAGNFYLIPSRIWELLLGALLAHHMVVSAKMSGAAPGSLLSELGALGGLLLIAFSVYAFGEETPFPGLYALVPTVGTALVIRYATAGSLAGKVLGWKPLVGVGLVSYSAYLWHQPLFAFARLRSLSEPGPELMLLLALVSILLAYFSWRFVERPFRNRRWLSRRTVFSAAILSSALPFSLGVMGYLQGGFPDRVTVAGQSFSQLDLDKRLAPNPGLDLRCSRKFTLAPQCRTSDSPEILVWGDSFAMHIVEAVSGSRPDAGIIQMTKSVCGPIMSLAPVSTKYPEQWARGCVAFNDAVADWIRNNDSVRYAVLASPFSQFLMEEKGFTLFVDGEVVPVDRELVARRFEDTLDFLHDQGIRPVVISPTPINGDNIGECVKRTIVSGEDPGHCNFTLEDAPPSRIASREFLLAVDRDWKVIWLDEVICPEEICRPFVDGYILYMDTGHLSREGARYVGRKLDLYRRITSEE